MKIIIESGDDLLNGVYLQVIDALEYLELPRQFVSFPNKHVHETNCDTGPIENFNALQRQKLELFCSLQLAKSAKYTREHLAAISNEFMRSTANVEDN
jgi:hypothetical protein